MVLGMLVTIYGLLEWYYAFDTWPEEVRTELKKAVKAKNQGDAVRSEAAFRKTLEIAHTLPLSAFEPEPLLKLTGLSISLAALLESNGQLKQSFKVLSDALEFLDGHGSPASSEPTSHKWTEADRIRAIGLSQKLGSLALQLSARTGDEYDRLAETYLVRALEDMIKFANISSSEESEAKVVGRDFKFADDSAEAIAKRGEEPDESIGGKVTRKGMGKTMEALADLYAKRGQYEMANPLYVQAITTLLPSDGDAEKGSAQRRKPSPADICQAATLMNTLSSTLLNPPTTDNIIASRQWSLKSLSLTDRASADLADDAARERILCGRAKVVSEFNLGVLAEMSLKKDDAIKYLNQSLQHARLIGFREGAREANEALQRIKNSATN